MTKMQIYLIFIIFEAIVSRFQLIVFAFCVLLRDNFELVVCLVSSRLESLTLNSTSPPLTYIINMLLLIKC